MSRVAIVAMGVSADRYFRVAELSGNTRFLFDEVWMINGFGHIFACDRVFHMDDIRLQALRAKNGNKKIGHLLEWLRTTKIPVYTSYVLDKEPKLERIEDLKRVISVLPDGEELARNKAELATHEVEKELIDAGGFESLVPFPLEEVVNHFRSHPYFNNTVAYAIALAAYEGLDMTIYGADFHYPENTDASLRGFVESGRGCCEYWCGIAVGRGIDVDISDACTLLDAEKGSPIYGYDGCEVQGALDDKGNVRLNFVPRPLPNAKEIEARYYKGPKKAAA